MPDSAETFELHLSQFSLDRAGIGILRVSVDGRLLSANEFVCQKLGYTRDELCALTIFDINPTFTRADWARHITHFLGVPTPKTFETVHRRKSGVTFPVEVTVNYLSYEGQEFFVACSRDLTDARLAEAERAALQAQLSHAQKLESVGRLAGGVAHDFNNMLTVILGRAEAILYQLAPGSDLREDLEEILLASQRSAALTRQLLAFARKQTIVPQVLDLNEVVTGMLKMLRRLIGESIELTLTPGVGLWALKLDPAQLDQVLVNLLVNARDAIAGQGSVALETANVAVDSGQPHKGIPAGDWVRLIVRDSGHGMDPQTLDRIFEPFFTTKADGRGTGLGLATVFGIVSQNGGFIQVDSAPGEGTTFSVYLPRHAAAAPALAQERETHVTTGGTETVLLVEDDQMVLRLTEGLLETLGYAVLAAPTPAAALELLGTHGATIDLLLADVAMPGMSGLELARRVRAGLPGVGVLLMSGYAPDLGEQLAEGMTFIRKPFARAQLDEKLRAALDAREAP